MKNRDKTIRDDAAKTDRGHAGEKPARPRSPDVREDEVLGHRPRTARRRDHRRHTVSMTILGRAEERQVL